jgi:mannitol-1-phosphate 5-dehydrogenase
MSGLFAYEAFASGAFERLVVSEIDPVVVEAVRRHGGAYEVNIAHPDGIRSERVEGVEILNPQVAADRVRLIDAISQSDEMATALPSVKVYAAGGGASAASLLAEGLARRARSFPTVVYSAENNNDAALLLEAAVMKAGNGALPAGFCCVDTVIGKMSGVITSAELIASLGLVEMAPGAGRALLVEKFNRILISHPRVGEWRRGIAAFVEKDHLEPFEDAKLYGHNATHALLAYLADLKGYETIAQAGLDPELLAVAREAFEQECGLAMIRHHGATGDPLFTREGWKAYVDDLLVRMTNPYLNDLVERVARDPLRKLGWDDRLVGAMRHCVASGVSPRNLAIGAAAAVAYLIHHPEELGRAEIELPADLGKLAEKDLNAVLDAAWGSVQPETSESIRALIGEGMRGLRTRLLHG